MEPIIDNSAGPQSRKPPVMCRGSQTHTHIYIYIHMYYVYIYIYDINYIYTHIIYTHYIINIYIYVLYVYNICEQNNPCSGCVDWTVVSEYCVTVSSVSIRHGRATHSFYCLVGVLSQNGYGM